MTKWWLDSLTPPPGCLDLPPVSIEATFCVLVMRDGEGRIFVASTGPGLGGVGEGGGETFLARVFDPFDKVIRGGSRVGKTQAGCAEAEDRKPFAELIEEMRQDRLDVLRTLFGQLGAWVGARVERKLKGGGG